MKKAILQRKKGRKCAFGNNIEPFHTRLKSVALELPPDSPRRSVKQRRRASSFVSEEKTLNVVLEPQTLRNNRQRLDAPPSLRTRRKRRQAPSKAVGGGVLQRSALGAQLGAQLLLSKASRGKRHTARRNSPKTRYAFRLLGSLRTKDDSLGRGRLTIGTRHIDLRRGGKDRQLHHADAGAGGGSSRCAAKTEKKFSSSVVCN